MVLLSLLQNNCPLSPPPSHPSLSHSLLPSLFMFPPTPSQGCRLRTCINSDALVFQSGFPFQGKALHPSASPPLVSNLLHSSLAILNHVSCAASIGLLFSNPFRNNFRCYYFFSHKDLLFALPIIHICFGALDYTHFNLWNELHLLLIACVCSPVRQSNKSHMSD